MALESACLLAKEADPRGLKRRCLWGLLPALLLAGCAPSASTPVETDVKADDPLRNLQTKAIRSGHAAWGQWGIDPKKYADWNKHSNRLIPVYTFGVSLDAVRGARSVYRDRDRLTQLYGREPEDTWNPEAEYFDQTDLYTVQREAFAAGKKYVILLVFDGLDWHTTRAAARYYSGKDYTSGRGSGLQFLDYRGAPTDYGYCVTSPWVEELKFDANEQTVAEHEAPIWGGYDPARGGATPWDEPAEPAYLIGKILTRKHAVGDSSATATSLCTGRKTYNRAIGVDVAGKPLETLAHRVQREGYGIGIVTNVPISHATPASAYAHNVARDDYQDLTRDLLGLPSIFHPSPAEALPGVDVLLGAGWGITVATEADLLRERLPIQQGQNFEEGNKFLAASDLPRVLAKYQVVQRTAGVAGGAALAAAAQKAAASQHRLFGFFGVEGVFGGHLPYRTADGRHDPTYNRDRKVEVYADDDLAENPTLAEMTTAALTVLARREKGFWLMVEAGDVDWASHSDNIDDCIGAVQSGDEAFAAIVRWVEEKKAWQDTALIVTSDHGHYFVLHDAQALAGPAGR